MINSKDIEKEFGRNAIKARMIDLAARLHGYEHFELESFDPLVDLMLSALAKELEKSHLFFQDTFHDLCSHITSRLIPEADISFRPSASVVHVNAINSVLLDANNLKCTVEKEIDQDKIEMDFVPLVPYKTKGIDIKLIANGSQLIQYKGLAVEELSTYDPTNSSIYLGVKIIEEFTEEIELPIYFSWFEYPKTELFLKILNNSEWLLNGQELKITQELVSDFNEDKLLKFWKKSYFKETFRDILAQIKHKYFKVKLKPDLIRNENIIPKDILSLIKKQPELSFANELHWIEIKLPHLNVAKELGLNLFAQTNCIPVINLNEQFETHKVRDPYKVIRISGEEYFVDVKKLYNHNEGEYLPRYNFEEKEESVQGYYNIARNSILRIDKRVAIQKIVQLVDLVREERNAFSAFNPDWIIDELEKIKINFQRIEYKLGDNLNVQPHDVFIALEDKQQETTVRIEYWTCNGDKANGIARGSIAELNCDSLYAESECLLIENTNGGLFSIGEKEKLEKLKYQLQTKDRIVTRADFNTAISNKLAPLEIKDITYEKKYIPSLGAHSGYISVIDVNVLLQNEKDSELNVSSLSRKVQTFVDDRIVSELKYRIKLKAVEEDV